MFLSPSRRVRWTQRGGKDSKRTVDGVEIEVDVELLIGR
jgi:hypothetical protein